eukprot:Skav209297  [mRNA]  locus=scaffold994:41730:49921:- [translate_table: standard]
MARHLLLAAGSLAVLSSKSRSLVRDGFGSAAPGLSPSGAHRLCRFTFSPRGLRATGKAISTYHHQERRSCQRTASEFTGQGGNEEDQEDDHLKQRQMLRRKAKRMG